MGGFGYTFVLFIPIPIRNKIIHNLSKSEPTWIIFSVLRSKLTMSMEIRLNKPDNRYIAGELLQGTAVIRNAKEEKVRCEWMR